MRVQRLQCTGLHTITGLLTFIHLHEEKDEESTLDKPTLTTGMDSYMYTEEHSETENLYSTSMLQRNGKAEEKL